MLDRQRTTYTFTTAYIPLNALPAITSDITICSTEGAMLTRQAGSALESPLICSDQGSLTTISTRSRPTVTVHNPIKVCGS
ncbi:MAG: hypothetical protein K8I82_32305 [Anaerolineae bacterium]|nr:hypothetical protein [Anaerolineae bacterium]